MSSAITILVVSLMLNGFAECKWLSPCGYVYDKEDFTLTPKRSYPRNSMHDLRHITHRIAQLLASSTLKILTDFSYEENWIPDAKSLLRNEGYSSPLKLLKHVLPEAFGSSQIFAFALEFTLENMRHFREDTDPDNSAVIQEILRRNSQMICEIDLIMRKYGVHFESISSASEQYTIPADWLKNARISDKTHRTLTQNEVFLKYQQFITTLHRILAE